MWFGAAGGCTLGGGKDGALFSFVLLFFLFFFEGRRGKVPGDCGCSQQGRAGLARVGGQGLALFFFPLQGEEVGKGCRDAAAAASRGAQASVG